jgi:phosphohistidine swiveling domain-containing protein
MLPNSGCPEAVQLLLLESHGIKIVPTLILGPSYFRAYRDTRALDDDLVSGVLSFTLAMGADEVLVRSATPTPLVGLPEPARVDVDRATLKHRIERCYRGWFDSKSSSYRETRRIQDQECEVSVVVQVIGPGPINSLASRNPRTGVATSESDYSCNVNNRIATWRREYGDLLSSVERALRVPSQIDFQGAEDGLPQVIQVRTQVCTGAALVGFVEELYAEGELDNQGALSVLASQGARSTSSPGAVNDKRLRLVYHMHCSGEISDVEFLMRVEPQMLGTLAGRRIQLIKNGHDDVSFSGLVGCEGSATGHLVFPGTSPSDPRLADGALFVCSEFCPDDLSLLTKCVGAVGTRGGSTSHLAVVTRGLRIPSIVGVEELTVVHGRLVLRSTDSPLEVNFGSLYAHGRNTLIALGSHTPLLRRMNDVRPKVEMDLIDKIDRLLRELVAKGEFAQQAVEAQVHMAKLRQLIDQIRSSDV